MKNKFSLQNRILIGCLLVVVCTIGVTALVLESTLKERLMSQIKAGLRQRLMLLEEVVRDRWQPDQPLAVSDRLADFLGTKLDGRVTLITPGGKVVGDSQVPISRLPKIENHANRPEVREALASGFGRTIRYSTTVDVDFLYCARRMDGPSGPLLVVRAALPLARVEQTISNLHQVVLYALALGVVLSLGMAYLVARSISRPMRSLTKTASEIASGDLGRRFGQYPENEIGELGRAFDSMADKLKEHIEEITSARDQVEAILAGMVEGVLVADRNGEVVLANQAIRLLLNLPELKEGDYLSEAVRNAEFLEAIRLVRSGRRHVSCDLTVLSPSERHLEAHVAALMADGEPNGVVAVMHDVTERQRVERMRRDFVANVSHELRTPLTAIVGSAETLLDGALDSPSYSRHFVDIIARQAARMERLAEDIMELASLESGQISQEREEFSAIELADEVLDTVGDLAVAKGLELRRQVENDGFVINAYRHQLEQAVLNLLDNAVKYTDSGGQVCLTMEPREGEVVVEVSDTGPGIEAEFLPRLFERFYRVDKDRSRQMGGTGLGLAIVKHVAQAHNGRVEVESEPGKGSTFRLILPA